MNTLLPLRTGAGRAPAASPSGPRPLAWATPMLLLFFGAHVCLGLAASRYSALTFLHALVTVLVGFVWATRGDPERAASAAAYIVGSEVFWRMTTDRLPWEIGKYGVILVCGTAIVRSRGPKGLLTPFLFFALLLPSAALTLSDFTLEEARQQISFNLSGPLAAVVCAAFFHMTSFSPARLRRVFVALVGPVVAIAAIVLAGILTASSITFNTESNFATSGGFGPNQVSAMLGLGCLFAFFWLMTDEGPLPPRLLMFTVMSWLATQSALTFSRGGMFAAGGAALMALLCLMRDRRVRARIVLIGLVVFLLGRYVVWPRLDAFTGGTISARFTEADVTRRDTLGWEDLRMWDENPLLGMGPGRSSLGHDDRIIAHTEFTRLLAEHGLLGAIAIVLFLLAGLRNVTRAPTPQARGLVLAMMTWACLFMANSAMRTAAPSLLFGMTFVGFASDARRAAQASVGAAPSRRVLWWPRGRLLVGSHP